MSTIAQKTTRPRGFAPYAPRAEAQSVVDAVLQVLDDYAKFLPLTLRQIFYRLVVAAVIGKTESEYKRLGEILNRARRGGLVSFDSIRDDGFTQNGPASYATAESVIATLTHHVDSLQIDRQAGQEQRLLVWCEASGMVPQLTRVAHPYGITVLSSGGFDSVTAKHEIAQTTSDCHPVMVLHLGDFDPSGEHVFKSLAEDVTAFATDLEGHISFERIAVTEVQVERYQLPTAPPKPTDARSFTGDATTQCEAFDPATLANILHTAIVNRIDEETYQAALEHEAAVRAEIKTRLGVTDK